MFQRAYVFLYPNNSNKIEWNMNCSWTVEIVTSKLSGAQDLSKNECDVIITSYALYLSCLT